jgi:Mg2+ and Co2+ transporter CorA
LIACDRKSLYPPKIAMAENDLNLLEEQFHLHPTTLQTLLSPTGTFSRHTARNDDPNVTIRRIQLLLKVPQKYEIANYGISTSSDTSRMTTALLFGERVTNYRSEEEEKEGANPPTEAAAPRHKHVSPFDRLVERLKQSRLSWDDPLLLPSAVLSDHLDRTRVFCEGRLAAKVYQMEKKIDVTKTGKRSDLGEEGLGADYRGEELAFETRKLFDRQNVLRLTVHLNTLYTRVLFTQGSPTWNKEASQWLGRIHKEIVGSKPKSKNDYALSELLEYNSNVAIALESVVSSLQSRMELQLNILYSFTSQSDNRINEQIALNSGRDSTSMKILALITAFFLPGTFVATLFSMSMFQWQPSGGGDQGSSDVVSDKFWIYWVVAVPLTVLTVVGWGVWWKWELKKYDEANAKNVSNGLYVHRYLTLIVNNRRRRPLRVMLRVVMQILSMV